MPAYDFGEGMAEDEGAGPWGVVVAIQANYYRVRLDADDSGVPQPVLLCTRRARLKKTGQQVMVGDQVQLEGIDWADGRAAITALGPRQTLLERPPVANADQILLVFALAEPDLDPQQMGRFLVKAEATGVPVTLCLNKQDLVSAETRRYWQDQLHQWGYSATLMSVEGEASLDGLKGQLCDRTTVISGPSGVGKSSLINRLIPQARLRTGAVSGKLGRGRHTTRHVELFELPWGGFLADTPGFNQPDLALAPPVLGQCFPEIRQRLTLDTCRFNDCLHRGDPGCAVGTDWLRYPFYLTLLGEAIEYQEGVIQQRDPEAALKVRMGEKGQHYHEPRLQTKKYRRPSRRSQKQDLDELRHGLDAPDSFDPRLDEESPLD